MTNSGITPPTPSPSKPAGNNGGQVVKIVTLPEGLQNVSRAVRLEGEVVGQNKDGTTRIKTSEGNIDVSIRGRQPQPGTKLEIDVPPGSPPKQVTVRPAPAAPPPPVLTTTPPPVTTQPAQGQPTPQRPSTPQTQPPATGTTLPPQADGTRQPPQTAPPVSSEPAAPTAKHAPTLPPLAPEQVVRLVPLADVTETMLQPKSPATTVIEKATEQATFTAQKTQAGLLNTLIQAVKSALPVTGATQPAITIPSKTTSAPIPNTVLPSPITLLAKIIAITSPTGQSIFTAQTATPAVPTLPPQSILNPVPPFTTPVTSITPNNMPVVQIPLTNEGAIQNFVLQAAAGNIKVGTQITMLPQIPVSPNGGIILSTAPVIAESPSTPATPTLPPAWRALLPLMQPSPLWPVLDEIFQTFYQATPQAAQILGRIIPSPANAANFGPAIMLFAASARAGDLQAWIGDKKLEMLQKLGKESLLSRLSAETSSLTQKTDAPNSEWRSYPIPLLWQNEISKVMFHARQESNGQDQDNKEGGTRFLLDLSLPRMGDVQLDGYLSGKRLDLIIRTQTAVSVPMQESMKTAYADALDGTEIFGELAFQGDLKNWVHVLKREENLGVRV